MGVSEGQQEWVKLEDVEQRVGRDHWHTDEKLDILWLNIIGDFYPE